MAEKETKFVPQSEASKKASNERLKRFALGPMTDLYNEQQKKSAEARDKKPKGNK
ncbi:hypothetical protein GGE45_002694 [Rhizobium aethiopicum]|uniref:hypothetical protein n=1 Tax=Rhizobium aethiopicum TaxID=1138170 RepID=UPI00160D44CA|nr:hypothetical protein [Rhizobium aethiopicum]MBB4580364.1 hypothetical protein [Rhizobium aethiopicum]